MGYGMPVYHIPVFRNNRFDVVGCEVVGRKAHGCAVKYKTIRCPNAERIAYKEHSTFLHNVLLNDEACLTVVEIIRKLWEHRNEMHGL
jgi:hypothetical protein